LAKPTIAQLIDENRRELLDLTTRNRLLSMPIEAKSARLVHAIGGDSAAVYKLLIDGRKTLTFVAAHEEDVDVEEREASSEDRDHTKLVTRLTPEALQRRLLTLFRDAQSIMEEQGVNILYLALGRLTWFEAHQADTPRYAPLLLVPVELHRKGAGSRFTLRAREDDLEDNLSLAAKLRADFGLELPSIPADGNVDLLTYFEQLRAAIASLPRWSVDANGITLGFFSFAKFLMYRDLDAKNWPDPSKFLEGEALGSLLGDGFIVKDRPFPADANLDALIPAAKLDHVVDADGSQALAIELVRSDCSLIIQGPPGTGKSQTITNVIATAVLAGKRVLFVAEKLAALEVVKRRLEAAGLGAVCLELHSHKAHKRAVLEEVGRTWLLGRPRGDELATLVPRLDSLRQRLNTHAVSLHTVLQPSGVTPFQILGALARRSGHTSYALPDAPQWEPAAVDARRDGITDLAERASLMGGLAQHSWRGAQREHVVSIDLPPIAAALERLHAALGTLRPELERASQRLRRPVPADLAGAGLLRRTCAHVANAPPLDRAAICHGVWTSGLAGLRSLIENGLAFSALRRTLGERVQPAAFDADLAGARNTIHRFGRSIFRVLRGDYRRSMHAFRSVVNGELPRAYEDRIALLDDTVAAQRHAVAIRAGAEAGKLAFGHAWRERASDWEQLAAVVAWVSDEAQSRLGADFRTAFTQLDASEDFAVLRAALDTVVDTTSRAARTVVEEMVLNTRAAFGVENIDRVPFEALTSRLDGWRARLDDLTVWSAWFVRARAARTLGLAPIVDALERGELPPQDSINAFERAYFIALYRHAAGRFPDLAQFDGIEHTRTVETFRTIDRDRLTLAKYRVLAKHHESLPVRHANVGMTGVLLGELEKKRGHRPIRRLLKDAGSVVQRIKPVFMMSPLSVAQFLQPGAIEFDLLVIDEASQIPPVDALGAFARAKQFVVVGDSKQLPPTQFFARLTSNDDDAPVFEDEDGAVQTAQAKEIESILGLCAARGLPQTMLRWHYRSRHPSLIAVSNYEFYDSNLFIVPSPFRDAPDLGLVFRFVDNGHYDRGGSATNRVEASVVCDAILEHARVNPQRSLGVAAFSLKQKQAIEDELERRELDCPAMQQFRHLHPYEPFFVKNLESVQGDERDVIFISVGYGRDSSGYFTMNFGPLSGEGGERRLNVLISRAKRQCVVFSSMRAHDIDLRRATGRGVRAFKTFLQYAETGVLAIAAPTGREADSPFETAVRDAVQSLGHHVDLQIGSCGFFVDLAVVDPAQPGRYLLGIECDGAAYHSSPSARDRDRLRQAVLEDHGWTMHRIWSSDWFRRPDDELKKVAAAIEKAKVARAETAASIAAPQHDIIRDDSDAAEEAPLGVSIPYVEARFRPGTTTTLHEVRPPQMAEIVLRIVQCEGPVAESEVITRVRELWGLERSGARIQEAAQRGVDALIESGRCARDDGCLFIHGAPVPVRDRSNVTSAGLRRVGALPALELRHAALETARALHGASESDLALAVARALGFRATSAQLRERILAQIPGLVTDGLLTVDGNLLRPAAD